MDDSARTLGSLPQELLGRILHLAGPKCRLVCTQFQQAYDGATNTVVTHPGLPECIGAWGPPALLPVPRKALTAAALQELAIECSRLGPQGVVHCAALLHAATNLLGLEELCACDEGPPAGPVATEEAGEASTAPALVEAVLLPPGRCGHLTSLQMRGDGITDADARKLADTLLASSQMDLARLQRLDLSCNPVSADGLHDAHSGLAHLASTLQTLSMLHGLRELVLATERNPCGALTVAVAALRAPHLSQLRALDLSGVRIGNGTGAHLLAAALQAGTQLNHLHRLRLDSCCLGRSGMAELAGALQESPHLAALQSLELGFNGALAQGGAALAAALAAATYLRALRALDLSGNGLGSEVGCRLIAVLRSAPHLASMRVLHLSENDLDCEVATAIADLMLAKPLPWAESAGPACLCNGGSSGSDAATSGLEALDLGRNSIGNAGASALAAALRSNSPRLASLQELDLFSNAIGAAGALALADALHDGPQLGSLQFLDLAQNGYDALPPYALSGYYSEQAINDEVVCRLASALRANTRLRSINELHFDYMRMGGHGTGSLAGALRSATHLSNIIDLEVAEPPGQCRLGHSPVTELAAAALSTRHLARLQRLTLRGVPLHDDGVARVASALERATHLVGLLSLRLMGVGIGDVGAARLAGALSSSPHLSSMEELNLTSNRGMEREGTVRLARSLCGATHFVRLERLALTGDGLGDFGVSSLAEAFGATQHLPRLRSLELPSSRYISPDAATRLARALRANAALPCLQRLVCGSLSAGRMEEDVLARRAA